MARSSRNIGDGGNGGAYVGDEDKKEGEGDLLSGPQREVSDVDSGLNLNSTLEITIGNGEPEPEENKNLGEGKNQPLEDQLKQIKDELRKNNEEMKMLRKTVLRSWNLLSVAVKNNGAFATSSIQRTAKQLIDKNKNHPPDSEPIQQQLPAQDLKTTGVANGSKQSSKSPQTPKPGTPLLKDKGRQVGEYDHTVLNFRNPKRHRGSGN